MKKIALCLCALLILLCAGAVADDKVTLTFAETMTSPERTLVLEQAIEAFEAAHPNIAVELVVGIPLMFILDRLFGYIGLASALPAGEALGAVFAMVLLRRILKKSQREL